MSKFKIKPTQHEGNWNLVIYKPARPDVQGRYMPPEPIWFPSTLNFNTKEEAVGK